MKLYCVTVFLVTTLLPTSILSEWSDPSSGQFHIQTDEGPERYFRYQTHSGQYRKEKRLEDGTVIGSYGWIDQNGLLRLREYIADNAGYRILKSKNVYVGRDRPISQAINIAKKAPAEGGTLVKSVPVVPPAVYQTTPAPVYHTTYQTTPSPIYQSTPQSYPSPTLPCADCNHLIPGVSYTPAVHISPNSIPSSTERPYVSSTISPISSTVSSLEVNSISNGYTPSSYAPLSTPDPQIYIPSTTPNTVYIGPTPAGVVHITSSTPRPYVPSSPSPFKTYVSSSDYISPSTYSPSTYISSTPAPPTYYSPTPASISNLKYSSPSTLYLGEPTVSTIPPPINSNSLDFSGYSSDPQYEHYDSSNYNPYIFRNGPTYPIDKHGHTYNGYNTNSIGGQGEYKEYDGVSVTNDGFRYYIPRAYHEEQNLPGNKKSGSFGYVDPFGIRRVIYYNAAPGTGFVHRKNNRYVGLNAPPYDPRPY